jgi:serpin B
MSDLDEQDAGDAVDLLGSGIATVAGAAGGAQVGKEAARGAAIGAAVGTVLEAVPVAGPILHAIAIAAGAIGGAISGALRDKYHPSPLQAGICLLLCRIAPGMIYAGFDTITTETKNAAAYACRLVRYWRLLAGLVKFTGPLYNPRSNGYRALPTDRLTKQPYIESRTPDPQEALTDIRLTGHLRDLVVRLGHQPAAPEILPLVRTQADAQAILAALQAHLAQSGVLGWGPIKTNLRGLRIAVGKVMTIAGETKSDPILSSLLGGEVRPQALRRRDHGPHALTAARRPAAPHGRPARPAAPPPPRPVAHPAADVAVSASDPFTELRARARLGADLVPSGAPPAPHGRPDGSPASGSDPFAALGRASSETADPVLDLDAGGAAKPDRAQSTNAFALDLYAKTRAQPGNLALSPLSIATALAMALAGARGNTAWQMERVLHIGGSTRREINAAGERLATYSAPRQDVILRVANRLFGDSAYRFEQRFLELTRMVFDAPLEPVDFRSAPREARDRINAWVERETQDRIKDLIPVGALDPLTRLVLVNAVYFLGDWLAPFERHATRTEPFRAPGGAKDVPMMHRTGRYRFATADGLKVLEMPYRGGDLAMVLLLPDQADGIGAVEARLSPELLENWLDALVDTRVAVSLPKFQLEPEALALGDMLSAMGMPLAFDAASADFTGIANPPSSRERIHLSAVFHKAFVKVDENGTEAAAATGAVMAARGISIERKPVEFKADHPFLFLIRDVHSGLILFMGRVCDPGSASGVGGSLGVMDPLPPYALAVGATARNDAGAVAGPTRAVLFFGPVGASQREGATIPGAEEHFFTCTGDGHPNCVQQLGAYRDGAGRCLPGLLRHLGVQEGTDLFIGAFSAGGSAVKRLLLSADDRAAIRSVVLSDATYEHWTDAQHTRPNVAEGYVAFALDALDGSKLFVATASTKPNNAAGVQQPSGSQTLARLAAEIGMRSGQPLEERATIPGYETLVPAPDRVWTRGGVILADFGTKFAHAEHVTHIAPMLWPAVVQPWAERHTAAGSEASGAVGPLDDTGDPFDTIYYGGATMLAERDARGERARERAAALLRRLVGREDLDGAEEDVGAPGPGRGRLYAPLAHHQEDSGHHEPGCAPRAQVMFPGLVLVHGVTPQGIDDPRLVRLAKALATTGLTVLTPEIPELAGGHLDPGAVDRIAQAVLALADRTGAPVGLVGLSIAGGLSLLAAAKPRCADSLSFVCAIGAHHDLGRVARFCLTNRVERIDEGWHRLEADPAGRRMLADILLDGASEDPGDLLAALVEARETLAALSPAGRLGDLSVPVFVLHGAENNRIPAAEAEWIARELPVGILRRQLVTPALSHVDIGAVGEVGANETAALVEFLADLLAHAETMAAPLTNPEDPHKRETMYDASDPFQAPRPRPLVLVPEAASEAGAPPKSMDADAVRNAILGAPPRAVPPAWKALDAPAQLYWWDPFGETWARLGDGRDREVAKVLAVFFLKETHFPVSYCLVHSSEGSEVIRAEKNASQDPTAGKGPTAEWRLDKAGVSHLWIPAYTFYARSFPPGETVRFNFAGGLLARSETGASEGDTGYPARPSLAALRKLEEELDAAWPSRSKKRGGNISDASAEGDRGVLDVPESPAGYGPALADVQAAVKRDGRVVETEIVTPSFWNSVRVPTLRIFTAERGTDASPWDLSAPATGPGWENYGRRPAAGDTSDPFFAELAELDASGPGDLGEASGLATGTPRWQHTMSQMAGVHAGPTYATPRVAEIAPGTPVRVVRRAVDELGNEWASIEWAPGFGRRGDGWVRASLLGGYDTAGEAGDVADEAGRLPELTDERLFEAAPRVLALLGDVAGAMKLLRGVQGTGPTTGLNRFQQKILDAINGTALDDGAGAITEVYALLGRDRGSAAVISALRGLPPGKALTRFGRRVLAALMGEADTGDAGPPETGAVARTYSAAGGETPQTIASRYGALSREHWAAELRAANPQRNLATRIYSGDVFSIPREWSSAAEETGAPRWCAR